MRSKKCTKCRRTKQLKEFYYLKGVRGGQSWCSECCAVASKIWHQENKAHRRKYFKKYLLTMPKTRRERRLAKLRSYYRRVLKPKWQAENVYKPELMRRPYVGLH